MVVTKRTISLKHTAANSTYPQAGVSCFDESEVLTLKNLLILILRQFYLTYPDKKNCYALRSKLTWSNNRLIMSVEKEKATNFLI
jgi:hypothetical protein